LQGRNKLEQDIIETVSQSEGQAVNYLFHASAEAFKKIPSSPIVYWFTESELSLFENPKISDIAQVGVGLQTGDNDKFVRHWHEINLNSLTLNYFDKPKKWSLCNKGGNYRKWYGNQLEVINWQENGKAIKNNIPSAVVRNESSYFKECITWSRITSGSISFRYLPHGFIHNDASCFILPEQHKDFNSLLSYLNSPLIKITIEGVNPTLNLLPGQVNSTPLVENKNLTDIDSLITYGKGDWDSFETSWDFTMNPLIQVHNQNRAENLSKNYQAWWDGNQATIVEMQRLEEENNRLFIDAYGLQDELTSDVPLEEITLTVNPKYRYGGNTSDENLAKRFQSDTVCELISYAIGCMMGRYSLDRLGLVYAHAGNESFTDLVSEGAYQTFPADDDGIIPITDEEWFADDATNRFVEFFKTVWGEAQLSENLSFIDESLCLHALKPKASESALETIRRYLSNQFYKDHMRTYKKRPIYWLFSSGKQKAFECVVYLHRYNEATLSRMRTEYVIPLMGKYQAHAEQLQNQIEQSDTTTQANKAKKALTSLEKKQHELTEFDEKLKNFADMRIALDLDDGIKVNYGKFGDLLVDVKGIAGKK